MGSVTTIRDIEFADGLRLDLTIPASADAASVPLLVWLHGGAWRLGDRTFVPDRLDWLASRGFAIACIDYRLSGDAVFPAQLDDVFAALRWLRANAAEYGYDPTRVGLFGSSAGSHLAALAAVTASEEERVQAVVDAYGPADLLAADQDVAPTRALLGGPPQENAALAEQASPARQVGDIAPPFLILHGTADPLVPASQSVALHDALVARGHDSTLYLIDGFGHGFLNPPEGAELSGSITLDAGHLDAEPDAPAEIRAHLANWAGGSDGLPASASFELISTFFTRTLT